MRPGKGEVFVNLVGQEPQIVPAAQRGDAVDLGRREDGAKEFRGLLAKYPRNSLAPSACAELKALGLSCAVAPSAAAKKKKARG